MGGTVSATDFNWSQQEEPHKSRRKEILEKHPEIKSLMVVDHQFKYQVTALVLLQFFIVTAISYFDVKWPLLLLITYIVGGTVNQALLLAIHEISHNMAFGHSKPLYNRIFSMFANLPIGVPMALSFKKYHLEHHRYLGHDVVDTDIPTVLEAKLFTNTLGKAIWMFFQSLFYAFRPLISYPKEVCKIEAFNFLIQFAFDTLIFYYLGPKALFYLIIGSLLGMGIHPVAGHFIAEHYMFSKGFETYSYYGILNKLTFNVGYHNEHHDFPNIPGSLLPKVREYAPEYYNNIPYHTSWVNVIYKFITDSSVGLYARMKRNKYDEEKRKLFDNVDKTD
ncbi:sphingolipid delta(4)-desaturase DES1 [Hydra vulgaris]|uniref:sphingolipid 4-desaturase n=1 Tax=Hydra vulgaris TaxID=6087 RepID=T2MIY6_HYDVU|nr:sphingolipid delta(4)-desaturase DES1 [Hydra vulgaris]